VNRHIDLPQIGGLSVWLRDLANAGGTGGLNWHVHAVRSLQRWMPTRELIAQFLAQVQPTHVWLVSLQAIPRLPVYRASIDFARQVCRQSPQLQMRFHLVK
jgi:hypothetical protein